MIFNTQKYFQINEVFLIFELPLFLKNSKFFEVSNLNTVNICFNQNVSIEKVECSLSGFEKCKDNIFAYYIKNISENSIYRFNLGLLETKETQNLVLYF